MDNWHYKFHDGPDGQKGPVTKIQLRDAWRRGELTEKGLVYHTSVGRWAHVDEVVGLKNYLEAPESNPEAKTIHAQIALSAKQKNDPHDEDGIADWLASKSSSTSIDKSQGSVKDLIQLMNIALTPKYHEPLNAKQRQENCFWVWQYDELGQKMYIDTQTDEYQYEVPDGFRESDIKETEVRIKYERDASELDAGGEKHNLAHQRADIESNIYSNVSTHEKVSASMTNLKNDPLSKENCETKSFNDFETTVDADNTSVLLYLRNYQIPSVLNDLLQNVAISKPRNPFRYLASELMKRTAVPDNY